MTVIRPNSVSGINSITVQSGNSLSVHKSDGTLIRTISGATGVSTFSSVSVGSGYTDNSAAKSINIGLGASIAQHNDNTLTFGTNGDPRITIDASGDFNVGSAATIKAGGNATFSGIVTAASFIGDGSGLTGAGPTLTGSTNNTIVTVTGANAIQGESGLTFDGSTLNLSAASSNAGRISVFGAEGQDARLSLIADEGDDHIDQYGLRSAASDNRFYIEHFESGAFQERFTIKNGGDVGINTNNPVVKLDISEDRVAFPTPAGSTILRLRNSGGSATLSIDSNAGNAGAIQFGDTAAASRGTISYNHATDSLQCNTSGSERLRIDSSGRVQIGHTAGIVGGRVEVHATTAETQITINESSDSGTGPALYINRTRGSNLSSPSPVEDNNYIGSIHFGSYDTNSYEKGASIICSADGQTWADGDCPARLAFFTTPDNSATPTEKMRILPDGRITTNGLDGATDITTTGTGDTYDGMVFGTPPLRVTRTSACPMFLNRNGSGGNIQEWRYGGNIVGYVSNTGNSLPSDRNYKKNITNLSLGLDLVNKLQPVSYHYKFDADSDPVMYGLVAQDVKTALNDAGVAQNTAAILQYEEKNDEKDSDYSLDYTKFTPILINAVKELSAEIESLKSEIAALKSS